MENRWKGKKGENMYKANYWSTLLLVTDKLSWRDDNKEKKSILLHHLIPTHPEKSHLRHPSASVSTPLSAFATLYNADKSLPYATKFHTIGNEKNVFK